MHLHNGQTINVTYDEKYQIQDLDSGNVLDRTYTYDGMGNISSMDKHSVVHDLTPVYAYSYTDNYSYTKISGGNVLQADNTDKTPARMHAYYSHNILGDVTVTKQYSIPGELTKELYFTYNDDHRLTEVKDGADNTIATYTYNGLGQRIKKQVGSVTTIFLYDLQGNIISEMQSDDSYDDYLYLEGSYRIAKITNTLGTDAIYYYHNDHLGTPIAMTDAQGNVVWKAAYKAFGEAQVDTLSTITNSFRFPGQYYDAETGLHYNYHRYYDPGTGRYLTSDPIGLKSGINLYTYVSNKPMMAYDKFGLTPNPILTISLIEASWATICKNYAVSGAEETFPTHDRKQHCYASCFFNRCMGFFQPFITLSGGIVHEIINRGHGFKDAVGDVLADMNGIISSYEFKTCKDSCNKCPEYESWR